MNLLFIDTETTGTDPQKHAMIEIAAELHEDGKKQAEFNALFYDKRSPVSLQALKYNNTRLKEIWSREGEDLATMNFVDWLLTLKTKGLPIIVGHNVGFDLNFVRALMNKYQLEQFTDIAGYKILDTCVIAQSLIMAGKLNTEGGKTTLAAIAKALNIDTSKYKPHSAKDDVTLTTEVFYGLIALIKGT